jgi:hypothetical protein
LCSGITVDPHWVLTARHCAEGTRFLSTYTTGDDRPIAARVTREYPHPELDVLLVNLADSAPVVGRMIWPAASLLAEDWIGRPVTLAGRGEDEAFIRGPLRTTEEVVSELDATFIAVDGGGKSGACAGDSGGPLLASDETEALLLLGTLSAGSASCLGVDRYVRSDLVRDWARDVMAAADLEPCAGIPVEGFCEEGAAVYCEDEGRLARTFCTNQTLCGWSKPDAGYRCLDVDDDPCRGVGTRGACEEGWLLTCEHGLLVKHDCPPCTQCVTDRGGSACR